MWPLTRPAWQPLPRALQSWQAPALPQAVWPLPGWHTPLLSQQPGAPLYVQPGFPVAGTGHWCPQPSSA